MHITLRPWETTEVDTLVSFANNSNIAQNLTNQFPHPYDKKDGEAFISMALGHHPIRIMAIVVDNEPCGSIGVHPQSDIFQKNAELGYWLAEPYWGKGIMTAAIKKMVKYAFECFDINRIFARPFGSNMASQRVLEKAGFELEATLKNTIYKNGTYQNELIYAIRK